MKVTEIKYTKKFNIGDYQSEEIGAIASLDEDENMSDAVQELRDQVHAAQAGEKSEISKKKKPKTGSTGGSKNPKRSPKPQETENEEDSDSEEESSDEETASEEDNDEQEPVSEKSKYGAGKKVASTKKVKGDKSGKKSRSKASTYNRLDDLHKKLVGEFLDEELPGWEKKYVAGVKATSRQMDGEDFLDEEGNVLAGFTSKFLKYARKK